MYSERYLTWLKSLKSCGLTNEQCCGLAMLYYWEIVARDNESNADVSEGWDFVSEADFAEMRTMSAFLSLAQVTETINDIIKILRVKLPKPRYTMDGREISTLHTIEEESDETTRLFDRCKDELRYLESLGKLIPEQYREPRIAFALGEHINTTFFKDDIVGITHVIDRIRETKSPFTRVMTGKKLVPHFAESLPFQATFRGFTTGRILEFLWPIISYLFYVKDSQKPINYDMQFCEPAQFYKFCLPIVANLIKDNRDLFEDNMNIFAQEKIIADFSATTLEAHVFNFLENVYGFPNDSSQMSQFERLNANVCVFYETVCALVKNINNPNLVAHGLEPIGRFGTLWKWTRDGNTPVLHDPSIPSLIDSLVKTGAGRTHLLFFDAADEGRAMMIQGEGSDEEYETLLLAVINAYQPDSIAYAIPALSPTNPEVTLMYVLQFNGQDDPCFSVYPYAFTRGRGFGIETPILENRRDSAWANSFALRIQDFMRSKFVADIPLLSDYGEQGEVILDDAESVLRATK